MNNSTLAKIEESACKAYIKHGIESLRPLVEEVVHATDKYNSNPSIITGSKRYDANKKLQEAIKKFAEDVCFKWEIEPAYFDEIIDKYMVEVKS